MLVNFFIKIFRLFTIFNLNHYLLVKINKFYKTTLNQINILYHFLKLFIFLIFFYFRSELDYPCPTERYMKSVPNNDIYEK